MITGANRGLGLGLVKAYALRPSHTVIAAVRTPSKMPEVECGEGSKVIVVQLDSGDTEGPANVMAELKEKGVTKIDVAIANAAQMTDEVYASTATVSIKVVEEHFKINTLGALAFFQACVPLMAPGAKFIWMSSGASIIDRVPDKKDMAYGVTKCAMNFMARYACFEEPDLIIFPLSPGWVQTEMGNAGAKWAGMEKAPLTLEQSVSGMMKVIDGATKETSGKHMRYDGSNSKW